MCFEKKGKWSKSGIYKATSMCNFGYLKYTILFNSCNNRWQRKIAPGELTGKKINFIQDYCNQEERLNTT